MPTAVPDQTTTNDGSTLESTHALLLTGSFSIDHNDVTIEQCDHTYTITSESTNRFSSYTFKAPTFYIMVTDDINANVNFYPGANDANDASVSNDDAWTLSELTYNDSYSGTKELNLPTGSANVKVATITTCDELSQSSTFDINMAITLGNDGAISGTASLSGNDFTGYIEEDITKAQEAYWFSSPGAPNANDGDVLVATVNTSMLASQSTTNDAINAMEEDVSGNVVNSWSLTINSVSADSDSNLSQYGQSSGANSSALFANDEKIVANSQYTYAVSVSHNGTSTVLANDYVFGMVKHAGTSSRA